MERYKAAYSKRSFSTIPETIYELYTESTNSENKEEFIGGISLDTKHSWLALGPYLQVFYSKGAIERSVWRFGTAAKEPNAKIVCIQEIPVPYYDNTLLVIGLQYGSNTGMVCVYNLSCAKVLRAIEIPQQVTSVFVISSGNGLPFPGPLSALDGIIAVGTVGGAVYLIDLCREQVSESRKIANILEIRNESHPCQLRILSKADVHSLEAHKTSAEKDGTHVAILLNENEVSGVHFELKAPEGRNVMLVTKKEVDVSALQYAPQLCSLFIGYNFGALQIFNILSFDLEYTSPVYEENLPVSFIAIQEPIDDPRAFCYFWAVYSYTGEYQKAFPLAALYSLSYESKDYHEGYGYIYRGLHSCSVRFQANLRMVDQQDQCSTVIGANCVSLQSYNKVNPHVHELNSTTSLNNGDDYALCMMVWNVRCHTHKFHSYLSLFDLNQWYKEQMPNLAYQHSYMNYMTHLCLSELTSANYSNLDTKIDPRSISPYAGINRLEEHDRPSSIAFDLVVLSEIEVCRQGYIGAQRGLFRDLEQTGPLALMHPEELYQAARSLGLAPLFQDMPAEPSSSVQCDVLLSIALERKMVKWLCKCATSWGNGSHRSVGLSLELLLNWGWERTKTLKSYADKFCAPLFDYSGTKLDANMNEMIKACRVQFGNLKDVFHYIVKHCATFLIHPEITKQRLSWMQKNYAYFNVIGWMINLKILPESTTTYPIQEMSAQYQQRRSNLKSLDHRYGHVPNTSNDYLLIDHLTHVESLRQEWRNDQNIEGLYPPATMQTLLRSYFNEMLDVNTVHSLIGYAMLDLVVHCQGIHENQNISATLIKFPQIFDLSLSCTKVIQAFWQFDRGQLDPAISQLVGRIHPHDLTDEQSRFIVQVLKLQGQYRLALKFMKVRHPRGCKEDVKLLIQLNVRNKMLFEALSIERRHRDDELFAAFLMECLEADALMELVSFNFSKSEELALLKFMDLYNYTKKEEFKTIYFVRRGRFLDFYMRHDDQVTNKRSLPSIVKNSLDSILPEVTKKVIKTCMGLKGLTYEKTKSLSEYVVNPKERAKFNNDFVKACVVNCKESWNGTEELMEEDFPFMRPPCERRSPPLKNIIYTTTVDKLPTRAKKLDDHEVVDKEADELAPPTKRMRLDSPRDEEVMNLTTIDTVFHQSYAQSSFVNTTFGVGTPHSILKTTTHSQRGESTTPDNLDDLRRSMTPKLSGRQSVTTPSVRFTGLSSNDSSRNSFSFQAPTTLSNTNTNTKESTTTDYFSAEMSFESSGPKDASDSNRKRKFGAESGSGDHNQSMFNDVEPSILRSSSNNSMNAGKFLESMRKSYVEEALPPEARQDPPQHYTPLASASPQNQTLHTSVFVFTANEDVNTSGLVPKARDTYQTRPEALKKLETSLNRQVADCSSLNLMEKEVRHETKCVMTSTITLTEVLNNGETHTDTKTVVQQEEVADTRREVFQDDEDMVVCGDRSIVCIDDMEKIEDRDVGTTPEPKSKIDYNKTIVDLRTPKFKESLYHHPEFVDYFSIPPVSQVSQVKELPKTKKTRISFGPNSKAINTSLPHQNSSKVSPTQQESSSLLSIPKKASSFIEPALCNEATSKLTSMISNLQSLKPPKFNLNLTAKKPSDNEVCNNTSRLDVSAVEMDALSVASHPATPLVEKTIPIIELLDTPVINKSYYERPSFNDYFALPNEDESLKLEVSATTSADEDGVKIVDITDEINEAQPETVPEAVVETEIIEAPEVNVYEDLSNPADGNHHYIIDPVMNNYNQPPEADYQADVPQNENVETPSETYNADVLPSDELFESMEVVNDDDSREHFNNAVDSEVILIGSSSDSSEEKTKTSDSEFSSNAAEVAYLGDSRFILSDAESNTTSGDNLDENVNEVKTSSKSESDTIVTESSVDVKEEVKEPVNEIVEDAIEEAPSTPRRRTRRLSSSKSEIPALTIRLRPRRSSVTSDTPTTPTIATDQAAASGSSEILAVPLVKAVLRTRSMSTDTPPTPPNAAGKRRTRAKSVDVVALNPIAEDVKPSPRRISRRLSELGAAQEAQSPKTSETFEVDLLTARRLTRNQKQIMNDRTIDRLQLLDKDDFQGTSDPEEVNLLQRSPPSSIASSSAAENARHAKTLDTTATPRKRGRPRKTPTPDRTLGNATVASIEEEPHAEVSRNTRGNSVDSGSRTSRRTVRKAMNVITEENETVPTAVAKRGRRRSSATLNSK